MNKLGKKREHKKVLLDPNWTVVRSLLGLALFATALMTPLPASAQPSEGGELFKKKTCVACHTIGKGKRVGPDLAGVTSRREKEWLVRFITSPKQLIDNGDSIAVELVGEYKTVMPDSGLSAAEIDSVLAYIDQESQSSDSGTPVAASDEKPSAPEPTEAEILRGQDLFQGMVRFQNDGPSCISCHNVKNDAIIGGGILAKELTTAFSTLGHEGTTAILGQPPFPVMRQAYVNHELTKEEISDLVAFLQHADSTHSFQQPFDYGVRLLAAGIVGCVLLLGVYSLVGLGRKRKSVYDSIHTRQVKSR
jgi:mono/diheme cytochrome c family protein